MVTFIILIAIVLVITISNKRKSGTKGTGNLLTAEQKQLLPTHVNFYAKLNDVDKLLFEDKIEQFFDDVRIEGVGLELTQVDRLLVASSAVIPIFGFKDWSFRNVTNVLLYPDTFDKDFQFEGEDRNIMGMVGSGYMNGQMILSRRALEKGFSKNSGKENTGIHEFVHLIDKVDGATDGVPEAFLGNEYVEPWLKMMHKRDRPDRRGTF
jgi:Mlc titration factor MtfA (ptsG expression regulator)